MKVDNSHNESRALDALMKVMRASDDTETLSPEEEASMQEAGTRHDLFLLASAERALTEQHVPLPDIDAELEHIVTACGQSVPMATAEETSVKRPHTVQRYVLSALIGAAAMLAILIGYHFWFEAPAATPQTHQSAQPMIVAETAQGQTMTIHLGDGSSITLNKNSRLTYPRTFHGGARVVRLTGQALFKVSHDPNHPFIVQTALVSTRVLGTVFDVKAYQGMQTRVALVEGRIIVSDKGGRHACSLHPGQAVRADGTGKLMVSQVNTDMETAWSEGMIYYDNRPLQDVLTDIAQRYHLAVTYQSEDLRQLHVNFATHRDATLDETLALLNSMGHFQVAHNGALLTVMPQRE